MRTEAWLERAARRRPGHPAVGDITYAELHDRARRAAGGLAAAGVKPGQRVGLALAAGEGFAVALHACLLHGAVAVPLDPRLTAEERARSAAGTAAVLEQVPVGPPSPTGATHDLDAPAVVVHTSGTTAAPRAVELTYGNWLWSAIGSGVALGHPLDERWLCTLPLAHVGGLSILLRSAIAATTVVLHDRFDVERVREALELCTMVSLVPTMLGRLLDAGLRAPAGLRWALLGGSPVPASLLARAEAARVPVAPTYGLTEACSQVATFGRPLFCTRVRLEADGEIVVAGPTVAGGGELRTGDLGAWEDDGRLRVVGRKAETIVTGGENVAPAEVEAVLEAHPAVAEAAVHGEPDPEWGEAIVATVVLRPGARADEAMLREHAASAVARFKVPKRVRFASALPRTASGKLRRRDLGAGA